MFGLGDHEKREDAIALRMKQYNYSLLSKQTKQNKTNKHKLKKTSFKTDKFQKEENIYKITF